MAKDPKMSFVVVLSLFFCFVFFLDNFVCLFVNKLIKKIVTAEGKRGMQ